MTVSTALLACDVFQDEIGQFLTTTGTAVGRLVWLEMGLHDRPDQLRQQIQAVVAELEADPAIDTILLAYGLCGNGLAGVRAGRCSLVLPRAHDCISILLGSPAVHSAILQEEPGSYFYSPGWIRGRRVPGPDREAHLRALYSARHPDDPEMVDELISADQECFAHHGCAAYVDVTHDTRAEAYCRDCAQHLGWAFRRLQGDERLLRELLTGPWPDERYLVVPPHHAITTTNDGTLVAATPVPAPPTR
jgi:hypothetical protein